MVKTADRAVRSGACRTELGEFLKARRARVSPDDVGLPPGERRRTPGLRREEVALLAGVGVTWYTWLEQGRPINASYQVLDAVARTLRLGETERHHLYRLAEATPMRASVEATVVPDAVLNVIHALDPLPALLVNSRWDWMAANDATRYLFAYWHTLPCVHKNTLWCCLTEPNARSYLLNYDEEVPYLVARLRSDFSRHLDDPEWIEDIRRLEDVSPEFAELWARHDVAEPELRRRRVRHPLAGDLDFAIAELSVATMPDHRLISYTPADELTWSRLPETRHDALT
ncbi:MAG TPA: helix-turn-helix transcriptional regulator [Nocardioidaceae bacterium]|nr:helix-turn-helix transcriptional regulator [Nocardioidaceae bacterium]